MAAVLALMATVLLWKPAENPRAVRVFGRVEAELFKEIAEIADATGVRADPTNCDPGGRGRIFIVQCKFDGIAPSAIHEAALLLAWKDREVGRSAGVDGKSHFLERNDDRLDVFDVGSTATKVVASRRI